MILYTRNGIDNAIDLEVVTKPWYHGQFVDQVPMPWEDGVNGTLDTLWKYNSFT
jgi:hypothetical protein